MKVVPVALVVVLLAWVMFVCAATTTSSEITGRKSPPPPPPQPQPIELDLKGVSEAKYSDFIATLRLKLKDPSKSLFGIPMLRKPSGSNQYILFKFISAEGRNSIVLAINKTDIYVQGYTYKDGTRARCFLDVFTSGQCRVIFPKAQNPEKERNIGYMGSYPELQGKAGVGREPADRRKVPLGMTVLGSYIDKISETNPRNFVQDEAKLLLIVIQMVSEAVRFKYIEDQVKANIPDNFYPNYKVISLENNWGRLSKAIAGADSRTGRFKNDVKLQSAEGQEWVVTSVTDIKPDMGLLNYVEASELLKWLLDHNVPVSAQ